MSIEFANNEPVISFPGGISGGGGGSDKNYVFTQNIPSSTWNINHGLNKNPSVIIVNSDKICVYGQIVYIDANSIVVNFNSPLGGEAYLN